jgi:hypothetical protein
MRIGTDEAAFLYHAGLITAAEGRRADARRHPTRLLDRSPAFDPLFASRAERALRELA